MVYHLMLNTLNLSQKSLKRTKELPNPYPNIGWGVRCTSVLFYFQLDRCLLVRSICGNGLDGNGFSFSGFFVPLLFRAAFVLAFFRNTFFLEEARPSAPPGSGANSSLISSSSSSPSANGSSSLNSSSLFSSILIGSLSLCFSGFLTLPQQEASANSRTASFPARC